MPLLPTVPAVQVPSATCAADESVVAADDAPGVDLGVCIILGFRLDGGKGGVDGCRRGGEVEGD